jgi:thiosulfate/3-mercaptopyruvate sulfurtransferase
MAYTTLIATNELASQREDSWVVVDCRYDLRHTSAGRDQYLKGHIPGAVYAHLSKDLSGTAGSVGGRHPIPTAEAIEATFGRLGIGPDVQVVMYDEDVGMFASRMWWMLRYMGHEAAAVLDGGWAKWTREGRPGRAGEDTREPATFSGQPQNERRLGLSDFEARIGDPSTLLIDARAAERFEGRNEPIDRAPGHIPGAANHFFRGNATDEGVMLSPDALRQQFAKVMGDRSPDQVVMYCGSGVTACQNLLAMEHAGLSGARLYPGSWSEWSSDPERPVETGPARRR